MGEYSVCASMAVVVSHHRPSHPNLLCPGGDGARLGFSPIPRQTLLVAPKSSKRREMFGESHEG